VSLVSAIFHSFGSLSLTFRLEHWKCNEVRYLELRFGDLCVVLLLLIPWCDFLMRELCGEMVGEPLKQKSPFSSPLWPRQVSLAIKLLTGLLPSEFTMLALFSFCASTSLIYQLNFSQFSDAIHPVSWSLNRPNGLLRTHEGCLWYLISDRKRGRKDCIWESLKLTWGCSQLCPQEKTQFM
jgi:hypothetical protein